MTCRRVAVWTLLLALGCADPASEALPDGGNPGDLGNVSDADTGAPDRGSIPEDAGVGRDATPEPEDAGVPPMDAGVPPMDAGVPPMDAGPPVDVGVDVGVKLDSGQAIDAGTMTATSCLAIKTADPSAVTGTYVVAIDGTPHQVFCDMDLDGGGWTNALLKNSAHAGAYPAFGASPLNLDNLGIDPAAASTSTVGVVGWLDLNATSYSELRLAAYSQGVRSFLSEPILRSSLRIAFGEPGYLLYNDPNGYYWCGGPRSYTDGAVGQINPPAGAPADCKTHTVLGSGWDFGGASYNTNMTMCGSDGFNAMLNGVTPGSWVNYPNAGVAYAIWIR
jgi:hypothetical protein